MRSGCRRHRRPPPGALPMLMTPTASRLLASSTPLAIGARRDHALIGEHQRAAAVGADDQAAVDLPGRAQAETVAVPTPSGVAPNQPLALRTIVAGDSISSEPNAALPMTRSLSRSSSPQVSRRRSPPHRPAPAAGVALAANTASATPRNGLPRPRACSPATTGRCLGSGRCDTRGSWALSSCHGPSPAMPGGRVGIEAPHKASGPPITIRKVRPALAYH